MPLLKFAKICAIITVLVGIFDFVGIALGFIDYDNLASSPIWVKPVLILGGITFWAGLVSFIVYLIRKKQKDNGSSFDGFLRHV